MKIHNLLLFFFSACIYPSLMQAQSSFGDFKTQIESEFNAFKEQTETEFERFRRERNEEYAKFLREAWEPFESSPEIPVPADEHIEPLMVKSSEAEKAPNTASFALFTDGVIRLPKFIRQRPKPIDPIEEVPMKPSDRSSEDSDMMKHTFTFCGMDMSVRVDRSDLFHLRRATEIQVAKAWSELSSRKYTNLVYDCIQLRDNLHLCDWAYLLMLQQMSDQLFGKDSNEAVLLTAYIYCQTGYEIRLGFADTQLCLLVGSEHVIYDWAYFNIDGKHYYPLSKQYGTLAICNHKYPQEQPLSLLIFDRQEISSSLAEKTTRISKVDPDMNFSINADKGMLDFYSSYPSSMIGENILTRWAMYANAPASENIQSQLYPQIRKAIEGCDQLTAVNKILNWIQTGFEYEYDENVWGHDRAFFPEESLFYSYCDCEDRSILLTRIVRDLFGLKCVLVYYPGHLAAAVHFTEGTVTGDYIEYEGEKFVIADATMLQGAPVGRSFMDRSTATVIILD